MVDFASDCKENSNLENFDSLILHFYVHIAQEEYNMIFNRINTLGKTVVASIDPSTYDSEVDMKKTYPYNLLLDMFDGSNIRFSPDDLPEDFAGTVEYVLRNKLKEKQLLIIHLRYMFGITLDAIGELFSVSKERIHQIQVRSLKIVRQDKESVDLIFSGIKRHIEDTCDAINKDSKFMYRNVLNKFITDGVCEDGEVSLGAFDYASYLANVKVDDLGLRVRSRNALRAAGVNTLFDIVNMTVTECNDLHYFGVTSAMDVIERCEQYKDVYLSNFREAFGLDNAKRCEEGSEEGEAGAD